MSLDHDALADGGAARPFAPAFLHGTRAALRAGALIAPGYPSNFGPRAHAAGWVYCTGTLDAAIWGAELAQGDGAERIYLVEATGPLEDDPELTDRKFPGNPSRSFRSRSPLRVIAEVTGWVGHSADALAATRDGVARALEAEARRQKDG
jgi:rifampin ADP-ribosylating transferase